MKTVGIEEFAAWAVQEEWPKANSADMEAETLTRSAILGALGLPLKPRGPSSTGEGFSLMVGDGALPAVRVAGGAVQPRLQCAGRGRDLAGL